MKCRVLVARSGPKPFPWVSEDIELLELVSHTLAPVAPSPETVFAPADVVLFTSQPAVAAALDETESGERLRTAAAAASVVVAVGEATAAALRRRGLSASVVGEGSAASLLDALPKRLDGKRILWPCAEDAATALPSALRERGANVERVVVYRKLANPAVRGLAEDLLERPPSAYCVTAPSAASWLFDGLPEPAANVLRRAPAVVLGPSSRRRLASLGVARVRVADPPSFEAAAQQLERLAMASAGK
jgi:uroporphyrinogen-III synthase